MSDGSDTASSFDISGAAVVACRMLLANPIPVLSASLRVIHLIACNILKDPERPKFRRLKLTNNKIRKTILEVPGAFQLLTSLGFKKFTSPEGDGYLDLPKTDTLKNLRIARDWIAEKIAAMAKDKKGQIMDILLQVKLPGGKSVQLGFNKTDRLDLLHAIVAKHLYCKPHFELRTLAPATTYATAALEQTLEQAGFSGRCCILVHDTTARDRGKLASAMGQREIESPHAKTVSQRERQQYFEKLRKQRKKMEKERVQTRRAVLTAFRDDREELKVRQLYRPPAPPAEAGEPAAPPAGAAPPEATPAPAESSTTEADAGAEE